MAAEAEAEAEAAATMMVELASDLHGCGCSSVPHGVFDRDTFR